MHREKTAIRKFMKFIFDWRCICRTRLLSQLHSIYLFKALQNLVSFRRLLCRIVRLGIGAFAYAPLPFQLAIFDSDAGRSVCAWAKWHEGRATFLFARVPASCCYCVYLVPKLCRRSIRLLCALERRELGCELRSNVYDSLFAWLQFTFCIWVRAAGNKFYSAPIENGSRRRGVVCGIRQNPQSELKHTWRTEVMMESHRRWDDVETNIFAVGIRCIILIILVQPPVSTTDGGFGVSPVISASTSSSISFAQRKAFSINASPCDGWCICIFCDGKAK